MNTCKAYPGKKLPSLAPKSPQYQNSLETMSCTDAFHGIQESVLSTTNPSLDTTYESNLPFLLDLYVSLIGTEDLISILAGAL